MHSEWQIFLPLRPALLPMAQRLALWAREAGFSVKVQLTDRLPPGVIGPALALGEFPADQDWSGPDRYQLDPLDWPTLAGFAQEHWPLQPLPRSSFGVTAASAALPGEHWGAAGLGLDLAPPEWALLQRAGQRGLQLATAESCTAGGVAARMAALPGSSAVLRQGFVVYDNAAKREMLGVRAQTLARHGAVSEPTVGEMLEAALHHADMAVAISGIAGPSGAVPDKPVGTVCLGWGVRAGPRRIETLRFAGDRWAVQYAAGSVVLGGLLEILDS